MQTPQAVAYTRWQTQSFQRAVQAVHAAGFEPGQVHLQASYGVLNGEAQNFTCARVGIALYGVLSDTTPRCGTFHCARRWHCMPVWPVCAG